MDAVLSSHRLNLQLRWKTRVDDEGIQSKSLVQVSDLLGKCEAGPDPLQHRPWQIETHQDVELQGKILELWN